MDATTNPEAAGFRSCGSCTLCCKVMTSEPSPLEHVWCEHCDPRAGGKIYDNRAEVAPGCITFNCLWRVDGKALLMPEELRPDRSKCVVAPPSKGATAKIKHFHVYVDADRPQAWLAPKFRAWLQSMMSTGIGFIVHARGYHFPIGPAVEVWREIWERDPGGCLEAFGIEMVGDYKQVEFHPGGERREKKITRGQK